MQIWLMRHGLSRWNKEKRCQGQSPNEPGLAPEGKIQAKKIARYLRDLHVSALWSSPLPRAKETTLAIYTDHDTPIIYDWDLAEISHGEVDGMLEGEIQERFPEGWRKWKEVVLDEPCFPGGELIFQAIARALGVLYEIAEFSTPDTRGINVVVSHGTIIAGLSTYLQGNNLRKLGDNIPQNGAISILDWTGGKFRVDAVNMIGHLEESVMSGNISI